MFEMKCMSMVGKTVRKTTYYDLYTFEVRELRTNFYFLYLVYFFCTSILPGTLTLVCPRGNEYGGGVGVALSASHVEGCGTLTESQKRF